MTRQEQDPSLDARVSTRLPFGPRTALFIGFGLLLVLLAFISLDALRILNAAEETNNQIRRDYLSRERTLSQITTGVYETATLVRDFILSPPDQVTPDALRQELHTIQSETDAGLQASIQSVPSPQRASFEQLAGELNRYWAAIDPIFDWTSAEREERGEAFLRSNVLSQRSAVLAIARDAAAVNDAELKDAESRISQVFANFRRRAGIATAVTISLGVLLAAATIVYASHLEKIARERYRRSVEARLELKRLSKRLVDAQEQERRAISRELHDEVGQSLSALLVDVENLRHQPGVGDAVQQNLGNIKALAENCVNEVRDMSLLLRPSMLDDLGLAAALEWQAREVSKRTGMLVEVAGNTENTFDGLPEEHKTCIYRVVQEALNNCSKHAHARSVQVDIRLQDGHIRLSIQDDGKGFDPARVQGLGLMGMKERVNQLGGVFSVDSDVERGTRLSVDLPVPVDSPDSLQGDAI